MSIGAEPDECEFGNRASGHDCHFGSNNGTACADRVDDWACRRTAIGIEEVWWPPDLGVEVVRGTTSTKPSSSAEHSAIGKQQCHAVVVSRNRHAGHWAERRGSRVEKFWRQDRVVIGKWYCKGLATDDEDPAVRKDDTVVKSAGICHGFDSGDGRVGKGGAEGNDMSV